MGRNIQRLAIIGAIAASIIGYLYHAPNTEGMAQVNRIRAMAASMKIIHFVGIVAERIGLSTSIVVIRKGGDLIRYMRDEKQNAGLHVEDTFIEGVPVRIARPLSDNDNLPAIVYFHGGAFYLASIETHNSVTSNLARLANVVVISVNYRLAPEHPFPAGLEDCYTVAKYVLEHGDSGNLRIDRNRVALAGDSAGGNLAAVNAMRLATNPVGKYSPRLQILIYPLLQMFDLMLPSYVEKHYSFFPYTMDKTLSYYFNEKIDKSVYANNHLSVSQKKQYRKYVDWSLIPSKYRTIYKNPITDDNEGDPDLIERAKLVLNPEVSPLLVKYKDLARLPSTYILSVGHDRLRDESFIYEGRLRNAGVPVVHNHYEHTFHASLNFLDGPFQLDIAHEMMGDIVKYIKEKL